MVLALFDGRHLHIVAVSTRQYRVILVWNIDLSIFEFHFPEWEELVLRHFPTLRESVRKVYVYVRWNAVVLGRILEPLAAEPLLLDMKD